MSLSFFVQGVPVGQGRPRFTTKGGYPRAYDPPKSRAWKKLVMLSAVKYKVSHGPICLCLSFVIPRLKTKPKAQAEEMKPDVDNLAKAVLDALTGVLWRDDKQIVSLDVRKRVAGPGEKPGVYILIP